LTKLVLNMIDHVGVCVWDRKDHSDLSKRRTLSFPKLSDEVREWADHNTPGYREDRSSVANFLMEVHFQSDRDAALFKLFWM
jgi:hypothetical protein